MTFDLIYYGFGYHVNDFSEISWPPLSHHFVSHFSDCMDKDDMSLFH